MRRALGVLVCALLLTVCTAQEDETQAGATTPVDALTRRQEGVLSLVGI